MHLGGGDRETASQNDFVDDEFVPGLRERCESSTVPPTFVFDDLLGWGDTNRSRVLSLIANLEGACTIRCGHPEQEFDSIFDAVLHVIEDDSDVTRFDRSRRAAIESAALVHGNCLDAACRRILQRFRDLGVRGLQLNSLIRAARNAVGDSGEAEANDPTTLARRYLCHPADQAGVAEDQPVLRYYRDEFYAWDGRAWRRLGDKQVFAQVMRFLQGDPSVQKVTERLARDVLKNLQGLTLLDCWDLEMPLWIASEEPLEVRPSPYLVLDNTMLNLQRLLVRDRRRRRGFDARNFSQIVLPYEYDRRAACPLWEETIAEILPASGSGDRRRDLLQEFMGWSLLPRPEVAFEKFLILVGKGSNGKSTILKLWEQLLGIENVSHVPLERFSGEFRLAEMAGKLANISCDMNRVEKVEEGLLKELTSGDPVQVNRKYKDPLTLRPTARLIFAANVLPPINDKSDGMWRRIIAMPFLVSFSGERIDRRRAERLREELPGIFNWAVEGARRLYQQGEFTTCEVCRRCADDHRFDSDPFMQFVDEECVPGPDQRAEFTHLYRAYRSWCERNGRKPYANSEFANRVRDLEGVTEGRPGSGSSRPRFRIGIGFRSRMGGRP